MKDYTYPYYEERGEFHTNLPIGSDLCKVLDLLSRRGEEVVDILGNENVYVVKLYVTLENVEMFFHKDNGNLFKYEYRDVYYNVKDTEDFELFLSLLDSIIEIGYIINKINQKEFDMEGE